MRAVQEAVIALLALLWMTPGVAADVESARAVAADDYATARASLADTQTRLRARRARGESAAALRTEAHAALLSALSAELIPAWYGTPWDFWGQTEVPGEGAIACGHWLATLMAHAGFEVPQEALGQQASELIVRTFAPAGPVKTWWRVDREVPVRWVQDQGPGVYLLGLASHAALLLHDGESVRVCHASPWEDPQVLCEDPASSVAMVSKIYVVGPALSASALDAWIAGRALPIGKRP